MEYNVFFSSKRADYETPWPLFRKINQYYNCNLDLCANKRNAKVPQFIDKDTNALRYDSWHDLLDVELMGWMNPPYGTRVIEKWVLRAAQTWHNGGNVIGLLPANTDTQWFQDIVLDAPAVLLLKGRIAFRLPCIMCGESTDMFYQIELGPKQVVTGLPKREYKPLCHEHRPDYRTKKYRSTAPGGHCVVFWLHRSRLRQGHRLQYLFGDLGKIIKFDSQLYL